MTKWGADDAARVGPGCFRLVLAGLILLAAQCTRLQAQVRIEQPPIHYSDTDDDNAVSRLISKIESGEVKLEYERGTGYLKSLLEELQIPVSSQVLVFSKTSLQVRYISPRNPRAIYFNDDIYVGWVRGSSLMEISAADPKLGAAFYTVEMSPHRVSIERAYYDCLSCHATALTQNVPGHTVRSVLPRVDGSIDVQNESFVTDHSSPMSERWGGWYVTGRSGENAHRGNAFLRGGQLKADGGTERLNLRSEFQTSDWLHPYSDIVALMVLEHQTQMHNHLTRADFTVRHARYDHAVAYGDDHDGEAAREARRELGALVAQTASELLDYLLFVDEAPLVSPIVGSELFRNEFEGRGPTDRQGRSLRQLDLETRLFRYPCSYLLYSNAFDSIDSGLRKEVLEQLWKILREPEPPTRFQHLDASRRRDMVEIIRETKPNLPHCWTAVEDG